VTSVALICVAGVSGTFLARRMRQSDSTLEISVAGIDHAGSALSWADVVLVAPQLAPQLAAIEQLAGDKPVAVLAAAAYTPSGSESAVQAVHDLVARSTRTPGESASLTETKE
jgi:cellobiose-specific phosphotransferase system component IIB